MNQSEWYVNEVLRALAQEQRERPESNERWLVEWQSTPQPRSAFIAWLGDRLVEAGERLRAWALPEPGPAYGPNP
ncbi:MAG: hypothetical protein AB7R89_13580 [Dehalococcoidia bacterium]